MFDKHPSPVRERGVYIILYLNSLYWPKVKNSVDHKHIEKRLAKRTYFLDKSVKRHINYLDEIAFMWFGCECIRNYGICYMFRLY